MNIPRIVGVHPIVAEEPIHLIEMQFGEGGEDFDWDSITQLVPGQDPSEGQVPFDERPVPGKPGHWCFYFHFLDLSRALASEAGELPLAPETPVPEHLRFMRYEEP